MDEIGDMNWYKRAQATEPTNPSQPSSTIDDFFENQPKPKPRSIVSVDAPVIKPVMVTMYRGFDADLNKLQRTDNGVILSPSKSEQGVMWFTHNLIRGYNAMQYVQGRGKYLLIYQVQAKKHSETVRYSDGTSYDQVPQAILDQTEPTQNCKFHMGYELPEGWMFSYKTEKFAICTVPLVVSPAMIHENSQLDE